MSGNATDQDLSGILRWYTLSMKSGLISISGMTSRDVRTAFVAFALTLPMLIVACDPGVTIRQAGSLTETGKRSSVILHIKSTRQFIGDTRYAPQITVTNTSEAPLSVVGAELSTKQKIYRDSSPRPQDFPKDFLPGQAQDFTVLFRLDDDVQKTFRQAGSCAFIIEMETAKILLARQSYSGRSMIHLEPNLASS